MGLFEYQCERGHVTEHLSSLANKPETVECGTCDQTAKSVVSAVKTTFHAVDRKAIKRSGR